jgi:hypothetical protein
MDINNPDFSGMVFKRRTEDIYSDYKLIYNKNTRENGLKFSIFIMLYQIIGL